MASGPTSARRVPRSSGARGPGEPHRFGGDDDDADDRARARRRLVVGGVVVAVALTAAALLTEQWRPAEQPPAEVTAIGAALHHAAHSVDRVAQNANGGWSVLFEDGEIQWFKTSHKSDAQLHPIRVAYEARHDPNVAVVDLHATVFAIVLSGRRQGSTLELGTAPTKAGAIAEIVRSVVRR